MKKLIFLFMLAMLAVPSLALTANVDYYLEIDDIEGESSAIEVEKEVDRTSTDSSAKKGNVEYGWKVEEGESAAPGGTEDINIGVGELENTGVEPDEIDNSATGDDDPQEASADYFLKLGGVEGESTKSEGVEPDEIDFDSSQKSNFAVLLSSGNDGGGDENKGGQRAAAVLEILKDGLDNEGVAAEQISLNFEKITTKVKQRVKLFGFIPLDAVATVDIDAEEKVKVKFPWWAFLASGKDGDNLGQQVFQALSNVLKNNHDAVMSIIQNIR